MAVFKANREDIPKTAVILTEEEAIKQQIKFLKNWKTKSDVWAINYGSTILASLSALSGIYINNHYRTRLRLFDYGRMSSYLPICVLPAFMSLAMHVEFVLPNVVLQTKCAVCTEMRASAIQAGFGSVYASVLAPVSSFALAIRYNTYNVPNLLSEPIKALQLWKKHTKPIGNILFAIFIAQSLAGSIVTYFEAKNVEKVNDKLIVMKYELDN